MNFDRLYQILNETTVQLRKGEVVEGTPELVEEFKTLEPGETLKHGGVLEIHAMPPAAAAPETIEKIDVEFVVIGVDKAIAERHRAELLCLLNDWPNDELAGGPSYIAVGATIGDQGAAFQLFALGQVLGLWKVVTPSALGFKGDEARSMAGMGFIMTTGYRPERRAA